MVYCNKCDRRITCFHKTKKGKRYCWECWKGILEWLDKNNKTGGCILCHNENIVWEDEVWVNFQKLKLCQCCYNEIYGVKLPLIVKIK